MNVSYSVNGNKIERTYFASYPDNVIVMKIKSSQKGKLNFSVRLDRPERCEVIEDQGQLVMKGAMNNGYRGDGMNYWGGLDASLKGGEKQISGKQLVVQNADEVVLYFTSTTNYVGYPFYLDNTYTDNTSAVLEKAMAQSYDKLLNNHLADYTKYYDRVSFRVTDQLKDTIPTDVRLAEARNGKGYLHLQELLFQYGRYLLISSSREGALPANLQGVWGEKVQTAWNGDYHMNINLQMNYWLCLDPVTNKWISIPSTSPENAFVAPTGESAYLCAGWHTIIR